MEQVLLHCCAVTDAIRTCSTSRNGMVAREHDSDRE